MTTAHKPTFHPAIGSSNLGGFRFVAPRAQVSVRDLNSHTQLKFRTTGQAASSDLDQRDLRAELLERERRHAEQQMQSQRRAGLVQDSSGSSSSSTSVPSLPPPPADVDDADDDLEDEDVSPAAASSSSSSARDDDSGSDDDDDDDDEDDEEELLKELARIKKEREEEKKRQELEKSKREAEERNEAILRGNPLLNLDPSASATVKRRWDDDVIFRNQARDEPQFKKRFINDAIRSDFHKKFLSKYIK